MNFVIGDVEKVVTVENTVDGAKVFEDFKGANWVAHTNHHLELDTSTLPPKAVSKSVPRLEFLTQHLRRRLAASMWLGSARSSAQRPC